MAQFNRWWDSLGRAERIVAISLGLSAPIAIINSTVWAVAVTIMHGSRQRARVEIERARAAYAREAALAEREPSGRVLAGEHAMPAR